MDQINLTPPTDQEVSFPIIKRGETVMQISVKRNTGGLFIAAKVHPTIEEFIRSLGTGETQDIRALGRHWTPYPAGAEFAVYNMSTNPGVIGVGNIQFRLDQPGNMLLSDTAVAHPNGREYLKAVNLSFLRIRGASESAGIRFHVRGVYTTEATLEIADRVKEACRAFYTMYLKPIDMTVMVQTQEIPT